MAVQTYTSGSAIKVRLGLNDSDDDTLLNTIGTAVNDWIEEYVGRPIGPQDDVTWTFDGVDAYDDFRAIYVRAGIRSITTLEVAPVTGADFVTAGTADYAILPRVQDRRTGWPGFEIRLYDVVSGDVPRFYPGYGNIRVTGDGGWEAIPPIIKQIADDVGVRLWHARQSGQTDVVGNDEFGQPTISRVIPGEYRNILRDYKADRVAVG